VTLKIDYDQAEFDRIKRMVREMGERAQDVSPAWDALLTWFSEQNFEQWLSRGSRYHTHWAPLAPSTLAEKFRKGLPLHPLIRTGKLVNSLAHRPLKVEHMTGSQVTAGTDVPYAKFHQTGTRYMPRRVLFSPAQIRKEQAATTAVANWIIRGERRVGAVEAARVGR